MANKATINDLITPMNSIEACLQSSRQNALNGMMEIRDAIDDLNGDIVSVLRGIERRMDKIERNAKANATNAAAKAGIAQTAPKPRAEKKSGGSNKFADFTKAAEMFSPQSLAAGVKAMSEIKMKDFLQFPKKMHYAAEGMLEPVRVMKYNHGMKPAELKKWAGAIAELGEATKDFLKDIRKSIISAKIIQFLTPKDVTKSGFFKATEMVATAIMCNIYGARYNKKTKTFTGGNFKRALELKKGAKVLKDLAKSVLLFTGLLALTAVTAPVALVGIAITALVIKVTTLVFRLLGDRKQKKELNEGSKSLMLMSCGIITFEMGLVLAAIVAPFALMALGIVTPIVLGSVMLFGTLGSKKTAGNVKNAAWAVTMMGISLIVFTGALVVSALILKAFLFKDGEFQGDNIAAMAMTIPVFALMLVGLWAFNKVGTSRNVKSSFKALVAIAAMSVGLIVFSACLFIANMLTKDMWKDKEGKFDPVAAVTSVAVFALMLASIYAFRIAGESLKDVAKGTVAVILMGIGIAIFGIGTGLYMKALEGRSWEDIGKAAALIGIFGVEFILLGIPVVFGFVALGSASVALMAVALGVFGFGVAVYMKLIEDVSWEQVGQGAGILGVYGAEFAVLGLLSPGILAADVAVLVMGPALSIFGEGLKKYMKVVEDTDWDNVWSGAGILGVYGVEFGALGLLSLGILAADAAIACMGPALATFAAGLKPFSEVFEEIEPKVMMEGAGILGVLALEFSAIGLASLLILPAAGAVSVMGTALQELGRGIQKWMDAGASKDDIDNLCYAVDRIKLIFIGQKKEDQNKGFFEKIGGAISGALAAPFDNVAIENTARGLKTAGTAIGELGTGLKKWIEADIDVDAISNMSTVIGTIGETFQRLGTKKENGNNEGSLLRRLIGIDLRGLSKTDMELGVRSVKDLGKALKDIAEGLKEWQNTMGKEFEGDNLVKFGENIAAVVGSVGTAFAALASDENMFEDITKSTSSLGTAWGESFGTFTKSEYKNRVQLGIEAVKGLGTELVGIAEGMKSMTEIAAGKLGDPVTVNSDWTVTPNGKKGAIYDAACVLASLVQVFINVGEQIQKQGMYEDIIEAGHEVILNEGMITDTKGWVDAKTEKKSYVGLAISSLSGLGAIVGGIANALKTMSEIKVGKNGTNGILDLFDTLQICILKTVKTFADIALLLEGKADHSGSDAVMSSALAGYQSSDKNVKAIAKMQESLAKQMKEAETKNFIELMGKVTKSMESAVNMMGKLPATLKDLNKGKADMDKFLAEDNSLFGVFANMASLAAGFSGAMVGKNEMVGHTGHAVWWYYKGKNEAVGRMFPNITKSALEDASDNVDITATLVTKMSEMLAKLPNGKKIKTDDLTDAVVSVATYMWYIEAYFEEEDIKSATAKVSQMDELITSANTMIGKLPLQIKLLDDMKTANEGGALAFDNLIRSINSSLLVLDNRNNTIEKATTLVKELQSATKSGVFNNISSNVNKMVDSINDLDGEKLKPYADMIMALRDMSAENSKFKELFEEMVKMLADIIKEIKESGVEGSSDSNSSGRDSTPPTVVTTTSNDSHSAAALTQLSGKLESMMRTMCTGEIKGENTKTGETYTITFKKQ